MPLNPLHRIYKKYNELDQKTDHAAESKIHFIFRQNNA